MNLQTIRNKRSSLKDKIKRFILNGILPKDLVDKYKELTRLYIREGATRISWYPWLCGECKHDNPVMMKPDEWLVKVDIHYNSSQGHILGNLRVISRHDEALEKLFSDLNIGFEFHNGYILTPYIDTEYTCRVLNVIFDKLGYKTPIINL